jgi:hypothetical protein
MCVMSDTPPILNYTNSSSALRRANLIRVWSIVAIALTWLVMFHAGVIAYYNYRAGFVLPFPMSHHDDPHWRTASSREEMWRMRVIRSPSDPAWETRPLTSAERAAFEGWAASNRAKGTLRSVVEFSCCLSPLLILLGPLLSFLAWMTTSRPYRIALLIHLAAIVAVFVLCWRLSVIDALHRIFE